MQPAKVKYKTHLSILLSRIPLDELKTEPNVSMQTKEQLVEYMRKKKMGFVAQDFSLGDVPHGMGLEVHWSFGA